MGAENEMKGEAMGDTENGYLTPRQLQAIGLLIEGKNDRETAEIVGVNRATVNIWRNRDNNFIAEYNSRINQLRDVIEATQHAVVLKAYSVLNKALDNELQKDEPDTRAALGVIRNFKASERLETNAEIIGKEEELREQKIKGELSTSKLLSALNMFSDD